MNKAGKVFGFFYTHFLFFSAEHKVDEEIRRKRAFFDDDEERGSISRFVQVLFSI